MRRFASSWTTIFGKLGLRRNRGGAKRPATYRRRQSIENLEARHLLSLTVNTIEDENDGYNVGAKSLREAIAHAATNDTIEFDASLTGRTIELSLGQITINRSVNIDGLGAGLLTIDANGSAANSRRIFTINAGQTVTISGVTLTGGYVTGSNNHGGAILNNGDLTLDSVSVVNNHSDQYGGAIRSNSNGNTGKLRVRNSTFSDNSATTAGAISVDSNAADALVVEQSAFINNQAGNYGALLLDGDGGGSTAKIINSTFSGNTATWNTGAIQTAPGAPALTIRNSTITENHVGAGGQGGGIRVASGTSVTLFNTIVAGNTAPTSNNIHGNVVTIASYNNLVGIGGLGGLSDGTQGNNINEADPKLGPLGDYGGPTKTHSLLPGSPAIDAGNNNEALDANGDFLLFDQRSFNRFVDIPGVSGSTVDIGAVEWHRPVAIGDFDGDGRDDEAFLSYGAALYVASSPNGKLLISKWADLTTTLVGGWLVGDFNGDGRDDLAYRTIASHAWSVAFSESTRFIVTSTGLSGHAWQLAVVGDFDGDGRDELAGRYDTGSDGVADTWEIIDHDVSAGFTRYNIGMTLVSPSSYPRVHAGDVNGDGRDDLVAYSGGNWWVALSSMTVEGNVQLSAATNVGNWFRAPWVTDVGLSTESVDVEGPYRKMLELFSEVYNTIELELYPGFMKGLTAADQTKAANPWEQAALLVDRLERLDQGGFASNDVRIASGNIEVPVAVLKEWLGVKSNLSVYDAIRNGLDGNAVALGAGGADISGQSSSFINANLQKVRFRHAWVQAKVPTLTGFEFIDLDPSWKLEDRQPGIFVDLSGSPSAYPGNRGTFDEFAYLAQEGNQLPLEFYEDLVAKALIDNNIYASLAELPYDGPIKQKQFKAHSEASGAAPFLIGSVTNYESFAAILLDPIAKPQLTHRMNVSMSVGDTDESSFPLSLSGFSQLPDYEGLIPSGTTDIDFDTPGSLASYGAQFPDIVGVAGNVIDLRTTAGFPNPYGGGGPTQPFNGFAHFIASDYSSSHGAAENQVWLKKAAGTSFDLFNEYTFTENTWLDFDISQTGTTGYNPTVAVGVARYAISSNLPVDYDLYLVDGASYADYNAGHSVSVSPTSGTKQVSIPVGHFHADNPSQYYTRIHLLHSDNVVRSLREAGNNNAHEGAGTTTISNLVFREDVPYEYTLQGDELQLYGTSLVTADAAYSIGPNTTIQFDFRSTNEGDYHSIGWDTNDVPGDGGTNASALIPFHGNDFGNSLYNGSGWQTIRISVEDYFSGTTPVSITNLVFGVDGGVNPNAESSFRNVKLYEGNSELSGSGTSRTIKLTGDVFKRLPLGTTYTITPRTFIDVDVKIVTQGRFHGIGWDSNNIMDASSSQNALFWLGGTSPSAFPNVLNIPGIQPTIGQKQTIRIPIGAYLSGSTFASMANLVFVNDDGVAEYSNLRIGEAISPTNTFWQREFVIANPQAGLTTDAIQIGYDRFTTNGAYRYRPYLEVNGVRELSSPNDKFLYSGENALITTQHSYPTLLAKSSELADLNVTRSYEREAGQVHSIVVDANQFSHESVVGLQGTLNEQQKDIFQMRLDGQFISYADTVGAIGDLLSYTGSNFWYDFNRHNESIDGLMHTLGVQQRVGSGIITSDSQWMSNPEVAYLNLPNVPTHMGVDFPNAVHHNIDIGTAPISHSGEAFQLVGYNSSALENAILEETINTKSISTIRGLQDAFNALQTDDYLWVFESVIENGLRKIYRRGSIGDIPNATEPYSSSGGDIFTTNEVKTIAGINAHSEEVRNRIAAMLENASATYAAADAIIRLIVPNKKSTVGDWNGSVYVAEFTSSSGRTGSYVIAPDNGPISSGGYSGGIFKPENISLPKLSYDLSTYAGDPVNVANGNMFRDETDIIYANLGVPLSFARHYDSQSKFDIGLGVGWVHSFSDRLLQSPSDANTIEWLTSSGSLVKFTKQGSTWVPPDSRFGTFQVIDNAGESNDTYVWRGAEGVEYHFKKVTLTSAGDDKNFVARLEKIIDRDGHGVQLTYSATVPFQLEQVGDIHDPTIRRLQFAYNANHIATLTRVVPNVLDAVWTYTYNLATGQLAAGSRLATVTSPSDSQTAATVTQYAYFDSGPSLGLMSKIIEPDAGYHKYEYYANGRVFRVTESVDLKGAGDEDDVTTSQSFTYNLFRELTEFVDENGNVETYLHDTKGQLLRQVHDDRSRLVYEYGTEANHESALMVKAVDERGAVETFDYYRDGETGYKGRLGELQSHTAKDGVVTNFEYWAHAYISELTTKTIVNPIGSNLITQYGRDSLGHVTSVIDPLGNRTDYTYYDSIDPVQRGLLKSETRPMGVNGNEAVAWETIGQSFTIAGDTLSVRLLTGNDPNRQVSADAIRIDRLDDDGVFTRIVDNNRPSDAANFRFTPAGLTWESSNGAQVEFAGESLVMVGSASIQGSATWTFRDLLPGTYRISASWIYYTMREDDITYQFFDGLPDDAPNQTSPPISQQSQADDFRSFRTVFEYDAAGNLTAAVTEGMPASAAVYDHFGKVVLSTDATVVKSFAVNDILGRTISAGFVDPDGIGPLTQLATTFTYDTRGRLTKTTDALGRVTASQFDLKGRLIGQTFADGAIATYGYDDKGNRTSMTDELGRTIMFVYDSRDRLIQTIHPDGAVERIQYDGAGNISATTDALGRRTEFTYDKAGRLLTTKSAVDTPDQIVAFNSYDDLGRLEESIDANDNKTTYRYDALGRVVETRVPDKINPSLPPKFLSTIEYDGNGRVVRTTIYDAARLLAPVSSGGADLASIPADPTSLIATLGESAFLHVTQTAYDAFDRPVAMTYADGSVSRTIYDAAGRVRYQFDELGRRAETTYDEYGRLEKSIAPDPDGIAGDQSSPVTEFQYDDVGNIVAIIDPRDFITSREYDARNRLIVETDAVGAVRRSIYDVAGQMVAAIDPRGFAASTRYDDRGRVVLQQLVDPDGASTTSLASTTRHAYDAVGNLLSTTDPLRNTTWFEYDSLNRLREESQYHTLIADDANGGDAMFSANADAQYQPTTTNYGRDYTYWEPSFASEATWTFNALEDGIYRVAMTWPGWSDQGSAAIEVYLNDQLVSSALPTVDQTTSPNDFFTVHGSRELGWEILVDEDDEMNVSAGDALKIVLTGDPNVLVVADAVRIDRIVSRQFEYDDNGNLTKETDTRGFVTTHNYNELNRLDQTVSADPDGTATALASLIADRTYDGFGNLVSEMHGHVTSTSPPQYSVRRTDTFVYDKRNRLLTETIDAGVGRLNITTTYEYDAAGNAVRVTDAEGFETHYRYDALNRLIDQYQNFGEGLADAQAVTFNTATLYEVDPINYTGTTEVSPNGSALTLSGDVWVYAPFANYGMDFSTILEFDLTVDNPADFFAIGFDSNNVFSYPADTNRSFDLGGRKTFGIPFWTEFRQSAPLGGTIRVHIPIGQYLSDAEKNGITINHLAFLTSTIGSQESVDQSNVTLSNVRLYQSDEVRTVTSYDAAGNVVSVKTASDPRNIKTTYEYDAVGRQTRQIMDSGGSMERRYSTVYDAAGNVLIERNDSAATQTVHEYDSLNRLTRTTLPDPDGSAATPNGLMTTFQYDLADRLIRVTNGEFERTYTDYDSRGRVITETDGNGDQTHYRYDSEGNLLSVTDAEQNATSYTYDGLNRLKTETNAFGTRTNLYDNTGNLKSITDRNGRVRQFSYDTLDRRTLEEWKTATNSTITHKLNWVYDDLGRVIKQVDGNADVNDTADDLVDTFAYDGLGRLVDQANYDLLSEPGSSSYPEIRQQYYYRLGYAYQETEANKSVRRLHFFRNASGSDSLASTWVEYDRLGRQSSLSDSDLSTSMSTPLVAFKDIDFQYDVAGNLAQITRDNGLQGSSVLAYDKANRLTSITHDLATDVTHSYAYDNASRIASFNTTGSGAASRGYGYDNAGQLTSKTGGTPETYTYDENGNRTAVDIVTGPGNRLAQDDAYYYSYDAEGNLTRRTEIASGEVTLYAWDHRNRLTGVETFSAPAALNFPSGSFASYTGQNEVDSEVTMEDGGRTIHLTGKAWRRVNFSSLDLGNTYPLSADTVLSFDFYSPHEGNMVAIGLDNASNAINDPKRHFQLAGAVTTGTFAGIDPAIEYNGGWQHYEIRLADFAGYAEFLVPTVTNYWQRLTVINNGGGGESFFRNIRLTEGTPATTSLTSTSYVYDAEGRRVQRTHDPDGANTAQAATSEYFVYDGSQLSMTFNDSQQLAHRYLYGPQVDQVLVDEVFTTVGSQQVSDDVLWLLADHQGTIRDAIDSAGTLRKHVDYDSFGQITGEQFYSESGATITANHAEAVDQLFYYTGQEWDSNTALYNYNARWYDPGTGRFLSQDPSGFDAGDPNLYRYVGNSPLNGTDPTGLFTQKPTDYLSALASNSKQYTGPGEADAYFRQQAYQRSFYDPFYQAPQYTGPDLSKEVLRINHLPKGTHKKTMTDDFGQTLTHAQTLSGETYAFDPETGVRDNRVLQYLPSERGNNFRVFADPTWRTQIFEGPTTLALAVDAIATYGGFFGARAVARPAAQVVKNLAVNAYENVLEYFVPGSGIINGRPKPGKLDDVPGPGNPLGPSVQQGGLFNRLRANKYPHNEVYVESPGGGYHVLDSYNPNAEIVSRKFTQLSDVSETTAKTYIREAAEKYSPGTKIANVPSSGSLSGQELKGTLYLEVPIQTNPIPKSILDAAARKSVKIRDVNGKVY